jgi:hypothetical protein
MNLMLPNYNAWALRGPEEQHEVGTEHGDELQSEADTLRAEVAQLRAALEHSKEGWENALEIGLFDASYDWAARNLIGQACAALAHGKADAMIEARKVKA